MNHEAGSEVAVAHAVEIESDSRLAEIVSFAIEVPEVRGPGSLVVHVNSSHHQSADRIGEGLRIVARCPDDGIIEATGRNGCRSFCVGGAWHPERSVELDAASRAIFRAFIDAACG